MFDSALSRYLFAALICATLCIAFFCLLTGIEPFTAGIAALATALCAAGLVLAGLVLRMFWNAVAAVAFIASGVWMITMFDPLKYKGFGGDLVSCIRDAYLIASVVWFFPVVIVFGVFLTDVGSTIEHWCWKRQRNAT